MKERKRIVKPDTCYIVKREGMADKEGMRICIGEEVYDPGDPSVGIFGATGILKEVHDDYVLVEFEGYNGEKIIEEKEFDEVSFEADLDAMRSADADMHVSWLEDELEAKKESLKQCEEYIDHLEGKD